MRQHRGTAAVWAWLCSTPFLAIAQAADGTQGPGQPQGPAAPVLTEQNYKHWLDFIRPVEDELKWRKIGWRTEFWEAVQEAKELQQPLLLWTMNGHPMACT